MAIGDIGTQIDFWNFETGAFADPHIIQISATVFAVVYRGPGDDGFLKTFSINSSGNITKSFIRTYEFDTSHGGYCRILHIVGDIYAIAYVDAGYLGYVITVDIDSAGIITPSIISTLQIDDTRDHFHRLFHIYGEVYCVLYDGPGNLVFIKTFSINAAGTISSVIDDFNGSVVHPYRKCDLRRVTGNVYAVTSVDALPQDLYLSTITISQAGTIGDSWLDQHNTEVWADKVSLFNLGPNKFLCIYTDTNDDLCCLTNVISDAGSITETPIEVGNPYDDNGIFMSCAHLGQIYYIIAGKHNPTAARVITFQCTNDGAIGDSRIDRADITGTDMSEFEILTVPQTFVLLVHNDEATDGYFRTFGVEFPPTARVRHEMLMGIGP